MDTTNTEHYQQDVVAEKNKYLGVIGAVTGILGALLLALNIAISPYGFLFFFVSSVSLTCWARSNNHSHQLIMQLVFTIINAIGMVRWLV